MTKKVPKTFFEKTYYKVRSGTNGFKKNVGLITQKSAQYTFFEGLNNNFFMVKTPIFFKKAFYNGLNYN